MKYAILLVGIALAGCAQTDVEFDPTTQKLKVHSMTLLTDRTVSVQPTGQIPGLDYSSDAQAVQMSRMFEQMLQLVGALAYGIPPRSGQAEPARFISSGPGLPDQAMADGV